MSRRTAREWILRAGKWQLAGSLALVLTISVAASAQPLRTGKVGDRITSLVTGLTQVDHGPVGSCGAGAPVVSYVDYVVPGRPADDDNASLIGLTVDGRVVLVVAFDEADLNTPIAVYADMDGNGLVTHVWSADDAPEPCAIVQQLPRQP